MTNNGMDNLQKSEIPENFMTLHLSVDRQPPNHIIILFHNDPKTNTTITVDKPIGEK